MIASIIFQNSIKSNIMHRITFLLTLFFSFPSCSFSQSPIEKYSSLVNTAEIFITKNNQKEAIGNYIAAFKIQKPFFKDIYNASVCAIKTEDDSLAIKFCYLLAQKGVGGKYFNKKIFQRLKKNKDWFGLILKADKIQDSIKKANKPNTDKLDSLLLKDVENSLFNRSQIGEYKQSTMEHVTKTTDSISNELFKILKESLFFGEDNISYFMDNDTTFLSLGKYNVMIIHALQIGTYDPKLQWINLIRGSLKEGKISSISLIPCFSLTNMFDFVREEVLFARYKGKLYEKKFPDDYVAKIERFREEFFFCSIQDLKCKIIFNLDNPNNDFLISGMPNMIENEFTTNDDKDFFYSQFKEIDLNINNCK